MEVSFNKDTYHTYMMIEGTDGEETEDEERMMSNQQSIVLLPFHVQQLDGKKHYYYDITGKVAFMDYIARQQADAEIIEYVIRFLIQLCDIVEEYLLNLDGLLLDVVYMYLDVDRKCVYAAYVPGMKVSFNEQLQQLSACLLENTNHKEKEGVLLVYNFYKIIRREDFTPRLLTGLLKEEVKQEHEKEGVIAPSFGTEECAEENKEKQTLDTEEEIVYLKKEKYSLKLKNKEVFFQVTAVGFCLVLLLSYKMRYVQKGLEVIGLDIDAGYVVFGLVFLILTATIGLRKQTLKKSEKNEEEIWDDTVFESGGIYSLTDETMKEEQLSDEDRTMILSGINGSVRLISLNKNVAGDLVITEFPCIVGSQKKEAKAVIEAAGISRQHALLEKNADGIFLMDLESTNGTRVNGEWLEKNEKKRLLIEDIIEFADVKYMYCGGGETSY